MRRVLALIIVLLLSSLLAAPVLGADWPMWRCDASRSATTTEELAATLHLQWVRERPALEVAWPDEARMRFDACYEPMVMGKTMYVGSPRADSLTALDTETGSVKWIYYADGPVRFAPVAWNGKVYFGSDDGYLYCLDAARGTLRWKFRGGPSERKVLGNTRLISTWPARGAPVIADGTIYWAAGIWPFMGIFIHALDAETGRVVWTNDGSGATYMLQPHRSPAFAGVAPQGYMVVAGDRLLIPGGRSVPACFDRRTGKFLYYRLSDHGKDGSFHVSAYSNYFFNDELMFDLDTGERMVDLDSDPVATDSIAYAVDDGDVQAHDIRSPKLSVVKDDEGKEKRYWSVPELWSLDGEVQKVWLKAGSRLYASAEHSVLAIEVPRAGGEPKVSWEAEIEGTPGAMLAADGKLFVVTLEGRIHCFGAKALEPKSYEMRALKSAPAAEQWAKTARDILEQTGVTEGYCLLWGVGKGRLATELARQSDLHIVAVDPNPQRVHAIRQRLATVGLYGSRVAVHTGDPLSFQFPPYMANLIVSEDLSAAGLDSGKAFAEKLFHPLRPYGGMACLAIPQSKRNGFAGAVTAAKLPNGELVQTTDFVLLKRVGALAGSANWTQQYADVANTCVSKDQLVRAPLGLLWFGGSSNVTILPRHGHGPPEQIVDGRLFIEGPNTMRAMDVYTGRMLWQVELPEIGLYYDNTSHQPGANSLGTNFACASDGVYVAYRDKCLRLDPATGKTIAEFTLPAPPGGDATPTWGYIGIYEDLLIAGASPVIFEGTTRPGEKENWDATSSKQLVIMHRNSGRALWAFDSTYCFRHNAIIAGAGKVFCIDRLPDRVIELMERRGETPTAEPKLTALDARTGKVVWSTTEDVFGTWLAYSEEHDILLQAGRPSRDMLPNEPDDRMIAYRGRDGKVVWDKRNSYRGPCMLHGDAILTEGPAFSLLTGEARTRPNPLTDVEMPWRFTRNYGCNSPIASEHLITFRSAAAGFFDLSGAGGTANLGGFKSGCTPNLIAANGVLNAPDYTRTCTCSYQNQTSLAFVHEPGVELWTFNDFELGEEPVKRVGINLGAPGDRMADDGTLWLDYPSVGGPSPHVPVQLTPEQPEWFRWHSSRVKGDGLKWVTASGAKGLTGVTITLAKEAAQERSYTVRLHFVEPDGATPGKRIFDVALQGQNVLRGFDVAKEAGGAKRPVVKEFNGVNVKDALTVALKPAASARGAMPVLCGIEVVAEA